MACSGAQKLLGQHTAALPAQGKVHTNSPAPTWEPPCSFAQKCPNPRTKLRPHVPSLLPFTFLRLPHARTPRSDRQTVRTSFSTHVP